MDLNDDFGGTVGIGEEEDGYTGTSMIGAMFLHSSDQEDSYAPSADLVSCSAPGDDIQLKGSCEDEEKDVEAVELFASEDDTAADIDRATSEGYFEEADVKEMSTTNAVDVGDIDGQVTMDGQASGIDNQDILTSESDTI